MCDGGIGYMVAAALALAAAAVLTIVAVHQRRRALTSPELRKPVRRSIERRLCMFLLLSL